jgi:hypothetical protein
VAVAGVASVVVVVASLPVVAIAVVLAIGAGDVASRLTSCVLDALEGALKDPGIRY